MTFNDLKGQSPCRGVSHARVRGNA